MTEVVPRIRRRLKGEFMSRAKKTLEPELIYLDPEDRAVIARERAERARLCDQDAIAASFKALARIRRQMQLMRANRAVALERAG